MHMERTAVRSSSLFRPVAALRRPAGKPDAPFFKGVSPRLIETCPAARSTSRHFLISGRPPMTKPHSEIDRNPFVPARDRVCRLADTLLIFSIALAGVSAAFFALINHLGAAQ